MKQHSGREGLLKVCLSSEIIDQIKHHLASKPAGFMRSCDTSSVLGLLLVNLVCLTPGPLCSCIRKQLDMADFVEEIEPIDSLFDRFTNCQ